MQFVNITTRTVFTSYSGTLAPGQVSPDGGLKRRKLEDALSEVVKVCHSSSRLGAFLHILSSIILCRLFDDGHTDQCEVRLTIVLICISLIIRDVDHGLFDHLYAFVGECLF